MTAYVIQSVQNTVSGTVSALAGTLPAAVRQGNCVVVVASSHASTNNGTVSSVTLGGAGDNFAQVYAAGGTASAAFLAWWADPSCTGGGSVVTVNWGGVSPLTAGNNRLSMSALEVGGLYPAGPYLLDFASSGSSASTVTAWNSGTILPTSAPAELWIGAVAATGPGTITGPRYPWINLAANGSGTLTLTGYEAAPQPGTAVFSGTFSTASAYNAGVVALRGLPPAAPSLPDYAAGAGPQQGDMNVAATSPLGFFQQRVVFRAAQLGTTTTLPAGLGLTRVTIQYDTVLEDPYQGWNPNTFAWQAPYTGFYEVTSSVSVTGVLDANLFINTLVPAQAGLTAGLIMPAGTGTAGGSFYCYLVGGQDSVSIQGAIVSPGSSVPTVNNPPSTLEITWVASASA
jgi:hypothetical protein